MLHLFKNETRTKQTQWICSHRRLIIENKTIEVGAGDLRFVQEDDLKIIHVGILGGNQYFLTDTQRYEVWWIQSSINIYDQYFTSTGDQIRLCNVRMFACKWLTHRAGFMTCRALSCFRLTTVTEPQREVFSAQRSSDKPAAPEVHTQ